jgi:hypothetical protein
MQFSSSRSSALEWLLVEKLGQPPDFGKAASLAFQVAVALMMLTALAVFIDWKMDFDELGCKSYCNCTARMVAGGQQYSVEPNGTWLPIGDVPDSHQIVIDRLEECEAGWLSCSTSLNMCRSELRKKL